MLQKINKVFSIYSNNQAKENKRDLDAAVAALVQPNNATQFQVDNSDGIHHSVPVTLTVKWNLQPGKSPTPITKKFYKKIPKRQ